MRITNLLFAVMVFAIPASVCAQTDGAPQIPNFQAGNKPANRKWKTAIQADVPVVPFRQKAAVTIASSPSKLAAPAFYSMKEDLPPLPFNPFPELEVFALGDNKFAYDDRAVDYKQRSESRTLAAESSGLMIPSGPSTPHPLDLQTDLSLNFTETNSDGFLLDICNTTPNVLYGVGAKSVLDSDPFNTWTLVAVFEAQSVSEQLSGTASAPTRFYTAVNLYEYVGPRVSIVSPILGTLSGAVNLQVRVTDILPLMSVKVYVDGVQVGTIEAGQNGTTILPTYLFPNGEHEIWVEVVNAGVLADTDGDSVADEMVPFHGWANITANFTNDVYMENYSPLYSAFGSITFQYAATVPQNYTFEVFNLSGGLLHTNSGQSVNGAINAQWDFTDLSGNPVNDSGYVFSLTSSSQAGKAPSKKIITTNFFDHGITVGKYVVSYGTWPSSSLNDGLASMNASVSARVNWAAYFDEDIIGSGREDYNTIYADFTSDPFPIRQATQTNDLAALTNALANSSVGSWLFDGHANQSILIPGRDSYLTVELRAKHLAAVLGNDYGFITGGPVFSVSYGRRLFSTFITGCSAAIGSSEWPDATGTPMCVNQIANTQIKKSAFLGFTELSNSGSTKFSWISRIHVEWLDGSAYDTPLYYAVYIANNSNPTVMNWGPRIIGYAPLKYNGDDSR